MNIQCCYVCVTPDRPFNGKNQQDAVTVACAHLLGHTEESSDSHYNCIHGVLTAAHYCLQVLDERRADHNWIHRQMRRRAVTTGSVDGHVKSVACSHHCTLLHSDLADSAGKKHRQHPRNHSRDEDQGTQLCHGAQRQQQMTRKSVMAE